MTQETIKYNLFSYDIWTDEEGQPYANDRYFTDYEVSLNKDATDADIVRALIDIGFLKAEVTEDMVYIDGEIEYSLYIFDASNMEPVCELVNKAL